MKLEKQTQLYFQACREVRELPECADYTIFKKLAHNLWLALMLKENLINTKEYNEKLVTQMIQGDQYEIEGYRHIIKE